MFSYKSTYYNYFLLGSSLILMTCNVIFLQKFNKIVSLLQKKKRMYIYKKNVFLEKSLKTQQGYQFFKRQYVSSNAHLWNICPHLFFKNNLTKNMNACLSPYTHSVNAYRVDVWHAYHVMRNFKICIRWNASQAYLIRIQEHPRQI